MLPLSLLKTAENNPMLVELKNGDTYNGRLVSCNMFMNICLRDVICTSKDGDRFWKMPEVYIRGASIKYMRIPDEIIDLVSEEEQQSRKAALAAGAGGQGRGGRGAGRIGGRGDGGREGRCVGRFQYDW
jgi:U6 snRNA-associated Sm-like protein LSm4